MQHFCHMKPMDAKKISNQPSNLGTMATNGALPKTRMGRLCCTLNPFNKCKICKLKICETCWKEDEICKDIHYFSGTGEEQLCNLCIEKSFLKNFYQKI